MYHKNIQGRGYPRGLWNACRAALAAAVAILFVFPVSAQEKDNGLTTTSVDPAMDAEIISRMRDRMDRIHREQHRPTVGLVLSGGGAKGAAHVGVIRYLEELEIPVDMICGTSMGGLVGGIASLGYDSHFMDSLLRAQDWDLMLSDRVDRSYFSLAHKKYRETYQVSIPFHYAKKDFQSRIDEQLRYFDEGAAMGVGENTLMNSLPSGYVYGFNVNNLLSSLSVGYQDRIWFDQLPIPFFCVAADMVSLNAKNWSYGSLKTAMRSTMSIPGLFRPVRTEGMILVDGGVRNNFPVDLARAMGVDIVIGVTLSDKDPSYSQLNSIVDIVMQFVTMLGRDSFASNIKSTDVTIKPVTLGYNMLSFSPEAIDTLIHRGYAAARTKEQELREIKELVGDAKLTYQAPRAIDINSTPVRIYSVEFRGLTNSESRFLQKKIGFKAGSLVNAAKMNHMMSIIEATGCFSTVTYNILGDEDPYRLVFNCEKGPRHQFGGSVRFDTEEWASFLFNVGLNAHKLSGAKLDFQTKIGRNQMAAVRGALDLSWLPTVNFDAKIENKSSKLYEVFNSPGYDCRWWGHSERLYLSNIRWTNVDFNIGAQYRYYRLSTRSTYGFQFSMAGEDLVSGGYTGLFADGTLYTFDRLYYPTKGVNLRFGYNYDFLKSAHPSFTPIHTANFDITPIIPIGRNLAFIPDIHLRAVIGNAEFPVLFGDVNNNFSLAHMNYVGGVIQGRYIDGQIPFIGMGNVYMAQDFVGVANLGLRLNVGENFFITATGGWFREADTVSSFFSSPLPSMWGAGLELAYRTPAGPFRILGTWGNRMNDLNQDLGLYVSFGYDF